MKRPAGGNLTFGLKRTEILSAQANGGTLLVLACLIVYEGIRRLIDPPDAQGRAILIVALVGIVVTLLATWQLARANRESMNIEGSFRHLLTDVVAFVLTAVAGVVILATGWTRADGDRVARDRRDHARRGVRPSARLGPRASRGGARRDRASRRSAPRSPAHPHVASVHDLHVWLVSSDFAGALGARARPPRRRLPRDPPRARGAARRPLRDHAHDPAGRPRRQPAAAVDRRVVGSCVGLIQATYVGHATVLIELDGARLLTDPVLRDRVLHLRRAPTAVVPPLGELDAVLVSHAHWDHLDLGSLKRLGRDVRIVIPRGAGKLVRRRGFADVVELDEGGRVEIGSVSLTATRADHDAGRGPFGVRAPAFGYLIEGTRRVYFAGDTDLFPELADLSPLDLALLPVAGWGPRVPAGHLDPRRAAEAARLLRARAARADPLGHVLGALLERRPGVGRAHAGRRVRAARGRARAGRRRPNTPTGGSATFD